MTTECATCRFWFVYDDVTPVDHEWRPCNHPSVGGVGLAPLKCGEDGCKKHVQRATKDINDIVANLELKAVLDELYEAHLKIAALEIAAGEAALK